MKQLICALLAALALAGCAAVPEISRELPGIPSVPEPVGEPAEMAEGEKDYYLEITTPEGKSLGTIPRGEVLESIFNADVGDKWQLSGERPDGLEPEYLCLVWQQKTLPAGQDPAAEREYEVVMSVTTFRGSDYVEAAIPPEVAGLWGFPADVAEQFLTFAFRAPEETIETLRKTAGDLE